MLLKYDIWSPIHCSRNKLYEFKTKLWSSIKRLYSNIARWQSGMNSLIVESLAIWNQTETRSVYLWIFRRWRTTTYPTSYWQRTKYSAFCRWWIPSYHCYLYLSLRLQLQSVQKAFDYEGQWPYLEISRHVSCNYLSNSFSKENMLENSRTDSKDQVKS